MVGHGKFKTPVTRQYIDVRPLVPDQYPSQPRNVSLPLLGSLPQELQDSIQRYIRLPDRFMSLASALLKYQFIHRNARIPWSEVRISKTPKPHTRPYWEPPADWQGDNFDGLEFNCSHQAGIVVLLGCRTPTRPQTNINVTTAAADMDDEDELDPADHYVDPSPRGHKYGVRVGVDVSCTSEPRRTPDLSTQAKLDTWVDTFAEMFSDDEREDMKNDPHPALRGVYGAKITWNFWTGNRMKAKARRFYACWALKEAYIKMVGEGLLAYWLRELEFVNVIPPDDGQRFRVQDAGIQVLFEGEDITETMDTVLEGLHENFIVATMTRGIEEDVDTDQAEPSDAWVHVDIEKDIRPCAEGTCSCLDL